MTWDLLNPGIQNYGCGTEDSAWGPSISFKQILDCREGWWYKKPDRSTEFSSEEGDFLHFKRELDVLKWKWSRSVMSDCLRPHGLWPTRLLCPWDFPGKNAGVGCHFLFQEIFPTQGLNPGLPRCRQTLLSEPPGHLKMQVEWSTLW